MSKKLYKEFISYVRTINDERQPVKLTYPLDEILFLTLCGSLSGCEGWEEIAFFGEEHIKFLKKYLPYKDGIPKPITIFRVMSMIPIDVFEDIFRLWFAKFNKGGILSIDGKTIRGSRKGGKEALHVLHAYDTENGILLGYKNVDSKTNEIPVIPEILKELDVNGKIITLDAMGAQRQICQEITDQGGDYVIGLKGNQGNLYEDTKLLFSEKEELEISESYDVDKAHGRIEERKIYATEDIGYLIEEHNWPNLKSVIMCEYKRKAGKNKTTKERLYYISSLEADALTLGKCIRAHWQIESYHWVLDVTFKEDKIAISADNAAANLGFMRRAALNMLKIYKKGDCSNKCVRTIITRQILFYQESKYLAG